MSNRSYFGTGNAKQLKLILGRTVAAVHVHGCNSISLEFTDGALVALDVEVVLPSIGLHGIRAEVTLSSREQPPEGEDPHGVAEAY